MFDWALLAQDHSWRLVSVLGWRQVVSVEQGYCWNEIFDATWIWRSVVRYRYVTYRLRIQTWCETNDLSKELEAAPILKSRAHTEPQKVPSMESGTCLSANDAASSHQQSELPPFLKHLWNRIWVGFSLPAVEGRRCGVVSPEHSDGMGLD